MQGLSILGQLIVSLGGVLGLIWLLARTALKRGWMSGGNNPAKPIRVVARHGLTKTSSLAVVHVGDRELLLGVGAHGVSVLLDQAAGQLMLTAAEDHATTRGLPSKHARPAMVTDGTAITTGFSSSARKPMLDRLRARTVRH